MGQNKEWYHIMNITHQRGIHCETGSIKYAHHSMVSTLAKIHDIRHGSGYDFMHFSTFPMFNGCRNPFI